MEPYITITAHYITDKWNLKARVLTTSVMTERHTAINIADCPSATSKAWDLQAFRAVHDNAAAMNLALEQLTRSMQQQQQQQWHLYSTYVALFLAPKSLHLLMCVCVCVCFILNCSRTPSA